MNQKKKIREIQIYLKQFYRAIRSIVVTLKWNCVFLTQKNTRFWIPLNTQTQWFTFKPSEILRNRVLITARRIHIDNTIWISTRTDATVIHLVLLLDPAQLFCSRKFTYILNTSTTTYYSCCANTIRSNDLTFTA